MDSGFPARCHSFDCFFPVAIIFRLNPCLTTYFHPVKIRSPSTMHNSIRHRLLQSLWHHAKQPNIYCQIYVWTMINRIAMIKLILSNHGHQVNVWTMINRIIRISLIGSNRSHQVNQGNAGCLLLPGRLRWLCLLPSPPTACFWQRRSGGSRRCFQSFQ